jgi:hypothetical protein
MTELNPTDLANSLIKSFAECKVEPDEAIVAMMMAMTVILASMPRCATVTDVVDLWRELAEHGEAIARRTAGNILDQRYRSGSLK